MALSEKGMLLPPPRAVAKTSRWRSVGTLLFHAIAFAVILKTSVEVYRRFTAGEDPSASLAKCPQVEPLVPGHQSPALSEMEAHLRSDKFRDETIKRLAGEDPRWETMYDFADYLKATFPLVYKTLALEKVNTHGLLYTWKGTDAGLRPTVFMAHQDVVPVAEETVDQWTHPPFSGYFDGKYIWGRGAADCKNNLIGILEAVELLINAGFEPKRTVIFSCRSLRQRRCRRHRR
ncbi:hypothetical protein NUW58_g9912 [Xylaria curta]|uniref:Uncharacterized protein n=1 Tax=Xylaria curta TaxID=42375 RepID=A0ACC1MT95_9PEZI|nr:hypothetical protein NUW58_g9912 [Xylaria curta]